MSEEQARSTSAEPADPVAVVGEFLIVDGCKVARVEPGGMLAFSDKCRGRVARRGCDQVRVKASELARVVESVEAKITT